MQKEKIIKLVFLIVVIPLVITGCNSISNEGNSIDENVISEYKILVLDEIHENPIEGAEVKLGEKKHKTNSKGIATFESISKGEKKINIEAPAYEDITKKVKISEDANPQTLSLSLSIDLLDLPEKLLSETTSSNQIAQKMTNTEDGFDKDVGFMVVKSSVNLYFHIIDEYNEWIENKITKIMKWNKESNKINLSRIDGAKRGKEWEYESENNDSISLKELQPTTNDSVEHIIEESENIKENNFSDKYINLYLLETNEENYKSKIYFSDDYTKFNYLEEIKFFIPQGENKDSIPVNGHLQVVHDEIQEFTVILFDISDTINDHKFEMTVFAKIEKTNTEKNIEFLYLENDDANYSAKFATKFVGVEKEDNMSVGLNTLHKDINSNENPEYAEKFKYKDFPEDILDGQLNSDLEIYGFVDNISSFPNLATDSVEHDFYRNDNFPEQDNYPNKNEIDNLASNMTYDLTVSKYDKEFELLRELDLY
ncbi:MAG: hypothetical protein ACOC1K_04780 [Nanoarchaeota archaeon]